MRSKVATSKPATDPTTGVNGLPDLSTRGQFVIIASVGGRYAIDKLLSAYRSATRISEIGQKHDLLLSSTAPSER